MVYETLPVRRHYPGLGMIDGHGLVIGINGDKYLLEWYNTTLREFADGCYDHIEIALDSLRRVVGHDGDLVEDQSLGGEGQSLSLFIEDDDELEELAAGLIANGFPHYYHPCPDEATLNCYAEGEAEVGQIALELWLEKNNAI